MPMPGEQIPFANVPAVSVPSVFNEKQHSAAHTRAAQRRAGLLPRKRLLGVHCALLAQARLLLWQWLQALSVPKIKGKQGELIRGVCNFPASRHPGRHLIFSPKIMFVMFKILLAATFVLSAFSPVQHEALHKSPNPPAKATAGKQIPKSPNNQFRKSPSSGKSKIQVVLMLDTSNSMDGLIDQTKAQLWKMVNRLADAQRQNEYVSLEIALYEYGNSGLQSATGYIRLVHPLSTDLDGLSEKLFELKTNGGDEYCGWVIQTSLKDIPWSADKDDLRIIVIAGNEPFDQGSVDYRVSCANAAERGIVVNTIHCGDYETGIATGWKNGADIGKGKYMIIDTGKKVVHISTPYDTRILECNERLNRTYIGYGREGEMKKERQVAQDRNAATYGASNVAQRAAAKSKSNYRNEDWDLVDAAEADAQFVEKLDDKALPAEFKGKSKAEIAKAIEALKTEREAVQRELAELEKKMAAYIAEETKKQGSDETTLDNVLISAVVEQAKAKGFEFVGN